MANGDSQVEVYSPDMKFGTIPASQMMDALAQGYKPKSAYVEAVHPTTGKTGIIPREQWDEASKQGFILSPREQQRVQTQKAMTALPGLEHPDFPGAQQGLSPFTQAGQQQAATQQKYSGYERESGMFAGQAAAGMATGGMLPTPGGTSLLGRLAYGAGRAGITGAGAATGTLAGGGTPTEAAQAGAAGAVLQPAMEAGTAVVGKALKGAGKALVALRGESPERIAELQRLFPAKETIEDLATKARDQGRATYLAMRPQIDGAPVYVAGTKDLANQAIKELSGIAAVPKPLGRVAAIPEPSPNVLSSDNPTTILQELAGFDQVPFAKAEQHYQGIETYIKKAKPTGATYAALKKVSGALQDAMDQAADREGVLGQWKASQDYYKKFAADFVNKGAPLRPFVKTPQQQQLPPSTTEQSLNKFLATVNDSRVMDALQRRGVPTQEIQSILGKGKQQLGKDVADAVTLRNQGRQVLNQQVSAANRARAIKYGSAAIAGTGILGELARYLATRSGAQKKQP